jgi:hypothetical protein
VACLAAAGQTNRQIAHGLYVTPKTVETHLAHVYAKLGIPDRGGLPATLGSEALGSEALGPEALGPEALGRENLGGPAPRRSTGR